MRWLALILAIWDVALAIHTDNFCLLALGLILLALFAYAWHLEVENDRMLKELKAKLKPESK